MALFGYGDTWKITAPSRQNLGEWTDLFGTYVGLPETGLSEKIAGRPTSNTQNWINRLEAQEQPPIKYDRPAGPPYTAPQQQPTGSSYIAPQSQPTGDGGQSQPQQQQGPSPEELARQQYEQQARQAIESGYSGYFNQLDAMLNEGLPAQQAAQRGIAESQYTQGVAGLGSQREEGMGLLGRQRERATESQARNLRDIAANLRNSFMAGNVYLGAQGAGDSSAANQYSYALTKLGTRQRGDIMKQTADIQREIADREAKLQNIYTDEVNRLASERDQKIMGVAQWFAEAQNQIREAQGRGELAKGQDLASLSQNLLNDAINNLNAIKQEEANRRGMLEEWALNNANSIQQVKANMQGIQGYNPQLPQAPGGIVGTPQMGAGGNMVVPGYNYSQEDEERNQLFSNPAWTR